MNYFFEINQKTTFAPSNEQFCLHVHDGYEIYMFLEGDAKYVVEEKTYDLRPYDVIIIRKNQLHSIYHNTLQKYSRIYINIHPQFFLTNNCQEYETQFTNFDENISNKIDADVVKSSMLLDCIMRAKKYTDDFSDLTTPISRMCVIEILYLLNNIKTYSKANSTNSLVKKIIEYINENFTHNITLKELENKFFVSKYHICHTFTKVTGLTVHQYITQKRLVYAKELIKSGESITFAANYAGFGNYTSFYRAFLNSYGFAPQHIKNEISKTNNDL